MARETLASQRRVIEDLRARIQHLETRVAIAPPAPTPTITLQSDRPCARCAGSGEWTNSVDGKSDECFRCGGTGIDPGKMQGRIDFMRRSIDRSRASRASVEAPRTTNVIGMTEERKAYFAAHPEARSATPNEIRTWWQAQM